MTTPETLPDLKPCPFCGGEAVAASRRNDNPGFCQHETDHWIYCDTEDCIVHVGMCETAGEAIAAWNRRPAPAPERDEERDCTCGAGHGSLEGHLDWCSVCEYSTSPDPEREGLLVEALRRIEAGDFSLMPPPDYVTNPTPSPQQIARAALAAYEESRK